MGGGEMSGFDYSSLIAERTKDFTGREWVFAEIDRWLADPDALLHHHWRARHRQDRYCGAAALRFAAAKVDPRTGRNDLASAAFLFDPFRQSVDSSAAIARDLPNWIGECMTGKRIQTPFDDLQVANPCRNSPGV
jgi:hypothetical protein